MSESLVLLNVECRVAHIELNRPDAYNALNQALAEELDEAIQRAEADPEVRVILLSGRGKAFCPGGDVKAMAAAADTGAMIAELAAASHRAVLALHHSSKPVVVLVHGSAAGAGLGYACAGDIVLAAKGARFLSGFIGIGVSPDSGTSWFLPQIVGLRRALELTLLNRVLTAEEALEWGLVTAVHPDEQLTEAGLGLARKLAEGPALGLTSTRRLVRTAVASSLQDHLDTEAESIVALSRSDEAQVLITGFGG